jgi:kinesin family protein 11
LTTKSVHAETVRIVDEQMKDIETQMSALDDFVTRARSQNAQHHDSHAQSLQKLSATVKSSYSNIGTHFTSTYERVRDLGDEMSTQTTTLQETLAPLDSVLREPLSQLRENIATTAFQEYQPTGETPQKIQYTYPTELPRTDAHENILAAMRRPAESSRSPSKSMGPGFSSLIPVVFNDSMESMSPTRSRQFSRSLPASGLKNEDPERPTTSGSTGLREVDVNVNMVGSGIVSEEEAPNFKKGISGNAGKLPVPKSKKSVIQLEGRENANFLGQSTGRRRSPRTAT